MKSTFTHDHVLLLKSVVDGMADTPDDENVIIRAWQFRKLVAAAVELDELLRQTEWVNGDKEIITKP